MRTSTLVASICLLLLLPFSASSSSSSSNSRFIPISNFSFPQQQQQQRNIITNLPGFEGPLPFQLQTGYVEVDESNGVRLFYYFIRSERNPAEDPVMLWLTGGPGCSAFSGLIYEIGPLSFDRRTYAHGLPKLLYKPDSWTKVSNVIFLDSPVGTGFSYSVTPQGYESSDTKAVTQIVTFLTKWFDEHPEFLSNPFYVAGDSYSGMIVPAITLEIAKEKEDGNGPALNLKGYLVGNPVTDGNFDNPAKVPFAHGMGLISDEMYQMPTYVVYKGRVPGVYDDWENFRRQVHSFSGNSYKGYHNRAEAEGRYARYLAGEMREMRKNRMKTVGFVMMLIMTMVMLYVILV